jgi:hypothetical protein
MMEAVVDKVANPLEMITPFVSSLGLKEEHEPIL